MDPAPIITDHAISRYLERTGRRPGIERQIRDIIEAGQPLRPRFPAKNLIQNGFKAASYYRAGHLVAVVEDGHVVTCLPYHAREWEIQP